MDGLALFFVVVMSVVGGVCAYVSDILGYKIGKKRISFKRIRPKYVARTSVVIAGMLIPLITIGLIYLASADFRTWLTKGQEAIEKNKQITRTLDEREKKNVALSNSNRILEDQLNKGKAELIKLESSLKTLRETNLKLTAQIQPLQTRVQSLDGQISHLNQKMSQTLAKYKPIEAEYNKTKALLDEAKKQVTAAQDEYKVATKRYSELSLRNLKLTNDNSDLTRNNELLQSSVVTLQSQVDKFTKEITTLQADKARAEADTKAAGEKFVEAEAKLAKVAKLVENLSSNYEEIYKQIEERTRLNPITYVKNEELGRVPVPGNISAKDASNIYASMLRRAKAMAADRGAEPDPVNYPFLGTVGFKMFLDKVILTEEEVESFWTKEMVNSRQDRVLIMSSATNRFAKEPVLLQFKLEPNPIVFRRGEIVAESRIDGRSSEYEIRNTIREFLRTFVNTKARSRKMIPVINRDSESFGEFTEAQYFDAVARAKAAPRVLRLVAVAQSDIRAGDPLMIDLEFR